MMTPYKPREISQSDVDILHELIISKRSFGISKNNPSLKLRFFRAAPQAIGVTAFSFSLNINQQRADLMLEPGLDSSLAHRFQELGGVDSFPKEFRSSLMALCSREIIHSLEILLQFPVTLWEESKSEAIDAKRKDLYFEVVSDKAAVEARGKITLSPSLIEKIIFLASSLPCMEVPIFSQTLLDGELVIASARLSTKQWHHLTAGALLFFDEGSAMVTGKGSFLLKHGKAMPLDFDQHQLQPLVIPLTEVVPAGFTPAPLSGEKNKQQQEKKEASAEASMSMELAFSVGAISLSIDEIIKLEAAASLDHPINISRPLKILAQGEIVGTGELVKINHQYALFVTQLL